MQPQSLRPARRSAAGAWFPLPPPIEIDYRIRRFANDEQLTRGLMRDPRGLDVTSLGEGRSVLVQQRDQRCPRKGTKGL